VPSELVIVGRLLLACVCGGLIGYQRETVNRPAGLRTHILVALGAALAMLVSLYGAPAAGRDPMRIAAQVVSGVGLLCAGTVIHFGGSIRGLTTAASLWTASGIGLAVGAGYLTAAVSCTALVYLVLALLSTFERRILRQRYLELRCTIIDQPGQIGRVGTALGTHQVNISSISLEPVSEGRLVLLLALRLPSRVESTEVMSILASLPGVLDIQRED
jgi:putative Mg2+ transporter-C (MgtC) family protein